jgi:ABC-2 type transport system permease protein
VNFAPASLGWFASHELRLAWRDALAMATGGRRTRLIGWIAGGATVYAVMLVIAWFSIQPWVQGGIARDKAALLGVSGMGLLFWAVTLSQALESVTRVYYARSDLDLILSSPASSTRLFAVRAGAVVLGTTLLGALLISPLVWSLAVQDGPHWLSAYLILLAVAALSVAIALGITRLLFSLVGPRRTRLVAQIVAGIVGAGFVIGIQAAAIVSHEGLSRFAFFQSEAVVSAAPDADSLLWLPARGMMGDVGPALILAGLALAILAGTVRAIAPSYARLATSAAGLSHIRSQRRSRTSAFKPSTQRQVLRRKEWTLLRRDPWLLSQTLMQLLYLVPPALLLWINYGAGGATFLVIVPVLVMAAGQLAGGLAWLAISGEDAHDLVATAPLARSTILRAKVEAVLVVIAAVLAPLLVTLSFASWQMAAVTAVCAALASAASTAIQLWFRTPTKRAMFRRRQTASRAATLSEAFSSILWAATGALWAAGTPLAIAPAVLSILVLFLARIMAPRTR